VGHVRRRRQPGDPCRTGAKAVVSRATGRIGTPGRPRRMLPGWAGRGTRNLPAAGLWLRAVTLACARSASGVPTHCVRRRSDI